MLQIVFQIFVVIGIEKAMDSAFSYIQESSYLKQKTTVFEVYLPSISHPVVFMLYRFQIQTISIHWWI